jgi:hypothetical protein
MKTYAKNLSLIGVSTLLLAGCCTAHHVNRWEYKVVMSGKFAFTPPPQGQMPVAFEKGQEALMNDLGKDGWIFVSESNGFLYFKRPQK